MGVGEIFSSFRIPFRKKEVRGRRMPYDAAGGGRKGALSMGQNDRHGGGESLGGEEKGVRSLKEASPRKRDYKWVEGQIPRWGVNGPIRRREHGMRGGRRDIYKKKGEKKKLICAKIGETQKRRKSTALLGKKWVLLLKRGKKATRPSSKKESSGGYTSPKNSHFTTEGVIKKKSELTQKGLEIQEPRYQTRKGVYRSFGRFSKLWELEGFQLVVF